MEKNYIDIMIQSLEKKTVILNQIVEQNKQQKILLQDPNLSSDEFEKNVENKAALVQELNRLDVGFEEVYARVRDELQKNKELYREQIAHMQELIRQITEQTTMIQTQEIRNKEQASVKFHEVRKQVKGVRNSQKVVKQYYQAMNKHNDVESQFIDNKK